MNHPHKCRGCTHHVFRRGTKQSDKPEGLWPWVFRYRREQRSQILLTKAKEKNFGFWLCEIRLFNLSLGRLFRVRQGCKQGFKHGFNQARYCSLPTQGSAALAAAFFESPHRLSREVEADPGGVAIPQP